METLARDLRIAARVLLKSPGFTLSALLCLGLGIGANSAVFSVVNSVLLRALPYADPDRLVMISAQGSGVDHLPSSEGELLDFRARREVFEQVAGTATISVNLTGHDEPERLVAARSSVNLFSLLGVRAALGRTFRAEEERAGDEHVVVLSDGLWRRRFGAERNILGRRLTLNDEPYLVVGVMPPSFRFRAGSRWPEMWIPLVPNADPVRQREVRALDLVARLRPGVTRERAQAELDVLARRFQADYPQYYRQNDWHATAQPLGEYLVGGVRTGLLVLFAAVGLVLLIACVNVTNLMLARATTRTKEVALRTALGAGRGDLLRQFLLEALLLAVGGTALGLLLAEWAIKTLIALNPEKLPRLQEIALDGRAFAFTAAVGILTGLLCGLMPALRGSRAKLHDVLKEGGKTSGRGTGGQRLRGALVIAEVALGLVVLVGAGLLLRSFLLVARVDPGFRAPGLLTFQIPLPAKRYADPTQQADYARRLLERLRTVPGVERATLATSLPLGDIRIAIETTVEGKTLATGELPIIADWRPIAPDYFRVMGIPLAAGRELADSDQAGTTEVGIVDEVLAQKAWPGRDPLGKRVKLNRPGGKGGWITVVGVARHVRALGLDAEAGEQIYTPFAQTPFPFLAAALRTQGDPSSIAGSVRQAVWSIDRDVPVDKMRSMEQVLADSLAGRRTYALLLGVFAAVALTLVVIGVYGVMAYSVAQRVQEIGIRVALGAQQGSVLKLVVGQGLVLAACGVAVGLLLSLGLSRFVGSLLFGVGATDLATLAGGALGLLALALVATWVPARRATRIDPLLALRAG